MYKLIFKKTAQKNLERLPDLISQQIVFKINTLKENPLPQGVKKLSGIQNFYRIRIADYRVIYSINNNILTIEIVRIAHRKDVYR